MHKNVFIDTSIYVQQTFNFEHSIFRDIINLIDSGYISLYSTVITDFEVISNIETRVDEATQYVKSLTKNGGIFRYTSPFKSAFKKDVQNIALNEIKESYKCFIEEADVKNIPINTVDVDSIFNKYFALKPPFSKKKKHEFPDAFVLESIKEWCSRNKQEIIIVSKDKDMKEFCDNNKNLTIVESLAELLNNFTSNDQIKKYSHVLNIYFQNKKEIEEYIKWNIVENHAIEVADVYAYLDGITPESVKVNGDVLISRIEETKAYLNFTITFSYEAVLSVLDETNSIYDSESKGWFIEEYKNIRSENSLDVPIGLEMDNIDFKNLKLDDLSISNIDINDNQPIFITIDEA